MGRMRSARRLPGTEHSRREVVGLLPLAAAIVAALTAVLVWCSTPDGPRDDLRRTLGRVSMTVAGAATTVDNLERLPASAWTADRALADAAARVDEAERRILLLDVESADEPARRQALRLVQETAEDLAESREWATGIDPDRPAPTAALRDLANRLLELSDEIEASG